MRIVVVLGACATVLALAACGAKDSAGSPGAESSVVGGVPGSGSPSAGASDGGAPDGASSDGGSSGDGSSDQARSGSGNDAGAPDAPVSGGVQGSASLPSLPIGGNVSFEAARKPVCASLAWNGGDLPDGVAVRITWLALPDGVARASASCEGRPCLHAASFTADERSCTVGLRWNGASASGTEETISATGKVTCEKQSDCDHVKEAAASGGGTASVELPAASDSDSGSDSGSESGSDSGSDSVSSDAAEPSVTADAPEASDTASAEPTDVGSP
ncbi:hypothetical protein GCM10009798_42320 [Nocardioides panacihumi]|uniref:Ig-like domain-containing protein n=1 Tax=Nocardioides panacihumi TaxID=400774 RepID=A0ABN2RXD4_9ACTN